MTNNLDEVIAAALELGRAGRWERALALVDSTDGDRARLALAAAEVVLEAEWFAVTGVVAARIAAAEAAHPERTWDVDFLRLRWDYQQAVRGSKDPATLDRLGADLLDAAPDEVRRGWAEMYLGLIADNVRAERDEAPPHYEKALLVGDPLLSREALRHLGDHDHDRGDHGAARERWERATELGAGAGAVLGTLSQQLLLAVLARDAGDGQAAVALAGEVARWAGALGATRLRDQANGFRAEAGR